MLPDLAGCTAQIQAECTTRTQRFGGCIPGNPTFHIHSGGKVVCVLRMPVTSPNNESLECMVPPILK